MPEKLARDKRNRLLQKFVYYVQKSFITLGPAANIMKHFFYYLITLLKINKHPKMNFCFLTYTHALKDLVGTGLSKKARDKINIQTADSFNKSSQEYDFIFILAFIIQ